jgi:hypothetical protein
MDRVVGRDLSNMINTFFGGKRDRSKKNKKKQIDQAISAKPSPSASSDEALPQVTATSTPIASP